VRLPLSYCVKSYQRLRRTTAIKLRNSSEAAVRQTRQMTLKTRRKWHRHGESDAKTHRSPEKNEFYFARAFGACHASLGVTFGRGTGVTRFLHTRGDHDFIRVYSWLVLMPGPRQLNGVAHPRYRRASPPCGRSPRAITFGNADAIGKTLA